MQAEGSKCAVISKHKHNIHLHMLKRRTANFQNDSWSNFSSNVTNICIINRILAAEQWHQNKDFLAHEMGQLKKLKIQQVLKELEEDKELEADQQFYGEQAFQVVISMIGLIMLLCKARRQWLFTCKTTMHSASVVSMLTHRLRRWFNIETTPTECLVFAGLWPCMADRYWPLYLLWSWWSLINRPFDVHELCWCLCIAQWRIQRGDGVPLPSPVPGPRNKQTTIFALKYALERNI